MPTPRPIIATSEVVKSGIGNKLLSTMTSEVPTPKPMSAVPIGRPIARTEPKASTKITIAASRPYASLAGSSNSANMFPPYSMVKFGISTFLPISCISSESVMSSVCERMVTSSAAKAVVPAGLIWPSVSNGLVTVTPLSAPTSLNMVAIAALISSVTTPAGDVKTISPENPARSGLFASSNCCTSLASLFGNSNSVLKLEPIEPAAMPRATRSTSHSPTISRRRRTQKRARF